MGRFRRCLESISCSMAGGTSVYLVDSPRSALAASNLELLCSHAVCWVVLRGKRQHKGTCREVEAVKTGPTGAF